MSLHKKLRISFKKFCYAIRAGKNIFAPIIVKSISQNLLWNIHPTPIRMHKGSPGLQDKGHYGEIWLDTSNLNAYIMHSVSNGEYNWKLDESRQSPPITFLG